VLGCGSHNYTVCHCMLSCLQGIVFPLHAGLTQQFEAE